MQTFLPCNTIYYSLNCLDNKRLGKQRVEAMQILNALQPGSTSRWKNHPAVKMWSDCQEILKYYHNAAIIIWIKRGFKNNMSLLKINSDQLESECLIYGKKFNAAFRSAHRSNLLRKDFKYYSQFGWTEPDNLPYIWPA